MLNWLRIVVPLLLTALATVGVEAANTTTYYHNDLAGNPVAATNEQGQVIWRESYRPFGERRINSAAATNNKIWFTSRRQDAETGLVYMGARYYDPVIGRFISPDPMGFDEKNIHSHNRYAYANNNPYRFRDPNGLWAEDIALAGPGLAMGAVSLRENLNRGHYLASAVDVVGMVADGFAVALPGIPGGAGLAIAATRKLSSEVASSAANAALLKSQLASQEIAAGHAFEKHVVQLGEFKGLGIRTREQFAKHVEGVMSNPSATKELSAGRTAYWQDTTSTVVIKNPGATDGGTAFQPRDGRAYFEGLR